MTGGRVSYNLNLRPWARVDEHAYLDQISKLFYIRQNERLQLMWGV